MTKRNTNKVSSDGGPVFMGKVDNRGGRISGRTEKNYSTNSAWQAKLKDKEYRTRIIVALIGAIAVIIGAIITGILNIN